LTVAEIEADPSDVIAISNPFEIDPLLPDSGFYNDASFTVLVISPPQMMFQRVYEISHCRIVLRVKRG